MQHKCNLIIDSCCDLPFEVVDREGVELIRFPYIMSDGEHADDLYQTSSAHDFYQAMRNGEEPTTAQVPVPVFRDAFERAIASGVPTVYLSFSSGLSGSFDAAALVHDQLMAEHPDAELYIVDTCLASVAYAGSKLDVKPLLTITVDGKLSLAGVARGRKKGIKQLAEYYNKRKADSRPGRCVVIGNADCPKDAARLQEALGKGDDSILFLESSIGPVIGSHVGPDMIAVVFWGNDKREELSVADRIAKKVKGGE